VLTRLAGAALLPAVLVALVPLLVWVVCGALASALHADASRAQRGLALAWLGSSCASIAALLSGSTAAKQGVAALGYALAWPALASVAAVLWASRLSRLTVVALVTVAVLSGLVVRALPVGWPGEHSLSWWAMLPQAPRGSLLLALLAVGVAAAAAAFAASRRAALPLAVRLVLLTLVPALLLRALPACEHYGAEKHAAALASEINTSYFQVASGLRERAHGQCRGEHRHGAGDTREARAVWPGNEPAAGRGGHGAVRLAQSPARRQRAGGARSR